MLEAFTIATVDQIEHPVLRDTFAYWTRVRGLGRLPDHTAIDPLDMPRSILKHLVLADAEGDPADFRFRLMGTSVDRGNGFSGTGRLLTEHHGDHAAPLLAEYRRVLELAAPRYSTGLCVQGDDLFRQVERVVLPVSRSGGKADAVFGAILFHLVPETPRVCRSDARAAAG